MLHAHLAQHVDNPWNRGPFHGPISHACNGLAAVPTAQAWPGNDRRGSGGSAGSHRDPYENLPGVWSQEAGRRLLAQSPPDDNSFEYYQQGTQLPDYRAAGFGSSSRPASRRTQHVHAPSQEGQPRYRSMTYGLGAATKGTACHYAGSGPPSHPMVSPSSSQMHMLDSQPSQEQQGVQAWNPPEAGNQGSQKEIQFARMIMDVMQMDLPAARKNSIVRALMG